jgi:3'(2'), 5'-bisphosphate nucleotidase
LSTDDTIAAEGAGLLDALTTVVSRAAAALLAAWAKTPAVHLKPDQTPVTAADEAAEAVILEGIARLLPGVPIVSEEAAGAAPPRQLPARFVLVDPLDGTRELIAGRDEFSINVALISDGVAGLGIVAAPARGLIWRGDRNGAERLRLAPGAAAAAATERCAIRTRALPEAGLTAAVSRSHLDARTLAFLGRLPGAQRIACGSALKFCQVAEGAADLYPRLSPVREWDVAAGHAVLAAAGGVVATAEREALTYGRLERNLRVPGFIAWGDPAAAARLGV